MAKGVNTVALFLQMIRKRLLLSLAAVCASASLVAVTLWWNAHLSGIINTVSEGNALSTDIVVLAVIVMRPSAHQLSAHPAGYRRRTLGKRVRADSVWRFWFV